MFKLLFPSGFSQFGEMIKPTHPPSESEQGNFFVSEIPVELKCRRTVNIAVSVF